jgi:hypothetical protein
LDGKAKDAAETSDSRNPPSIRPYPFTGSFSSGCLLTLWELTDMLTFLVWALLFVVCWPLAILALVLYPLVWLVLLPFRIVGFAVGGVLAFLKGLFFLPARLLGVKV